VFRRAAVFGPGVDGGARQAAPEELDEIRACHEVDDPKDERRYSRGDIDPDALRRAAGELIRHGEATLRGDSIMLTARLITFWRGDAVLDIRVTGPGIASSGLSRVTRQRGAEDEEALAEYIRDALSTI
jgi:hypothetical protein